MEGAMKHPFTLVLEAQMAYLTWLYKMSSVAASNAFWMLDRHGAFLRETAHRRLEDLSAHGKPCAKGPCLDDHYGRRAHDVDVEHI